MRFRKLSSILGVLIFFAVLDMPSGAADWSAWNRRMPIKLARVDAATIGLLPIDATISLKAAEMSDPKNPLRELRLVYMTGKHASEVPFQLSQASVWDRDTSPSVKTFNCRITFFPVSGDQGGTYTLLYNNPKSQPAVYATDLTTTGAGPHWTIENSLIKVRLRAGDKVKPKNIHDYFGDSGQIGTVQLKTRPNALITNPHQSIHWNPGVFIPKRGWAHAYAWDPPAKFEIEKGPIFVEVRRSGKMPLINEVELAITYRFFKERGFVQVGTRLDILKDVGVTALRNNCCVFGEEQFTHMAWEQFGEVHDELLAKYKPINGHGDVLRLEAETPWFSLYHEDTRVGAATVYISEDNVGPWGAPPTQFDHAFYFTRNVKEKLLYWFRPQVYFAFDWDRKQLITAPKTSIYAEQNYYYYYDTEKDKGLEGVRRLSRAALNPPDVKVGPHAFPPPQ